MTRLVCVVALLLLPQEVHAWGFEAHRFIVDRALALLPSGLRPLFDAHRAVVVERAIDPDLWRVAGYEREESPHHFLNIDWSGYGPFPFTTLPRDYDAAVARFGRDRVVANGTLPWRAEEMDGHLRRAFRSYTRRGPSARFDIVVFSAWLAHYVSDAHVPFHAVLNHDGQLTKQHGIHARFEAALFDRARDRLALSVQAPAPVRSVRDLVFDRLVEGPQLAQVVLEADRAASRGRPVYDDRYYERFFAAVRPVLERRLSESIGAVAATIAGAWEAAGRPDVAAAPPPSGRSPRR